MSPTPTLAWKPLITVGTHHAPAKDPKTGQLTLRQEEVTPERLSGFLSKFKALRQQGVHFPVPWGHKITALPEEFPDEEQWRQAVERRNAEEARFNAGYIEDMRLKDDVLEFGMLTPPGFEIDEATNDLINPIDGTRIREVSAAIGNWTDGRGVQHRDIIAHAALCTMPVVAGMSGFTAENGLTSTLSATSTIEFTALLSTKTGTPMPKPDDKEPKEPKASIVEPAEEEIDVEPTPIEPAAIVPEVPPPPPAPVIPEVPKEDHTKKAVEILRTLGFALPPDTTADNFAERVFVVGMAAQAMGMRFCDEEEETPAIPTTDKPASRTVGMEDEPKPMPPPVNLSTGQPQVTYLSTNSIQDPGFRKHAEKEQVRTRKLIDDLWTRCKHLGCPVHIANREAAKGQLVMLSLNTQTQEFATPAALAKVRLVKEVLESTHGYSPTGDDGIEVWLASASIPENPAATAEKRHSAKGQPYAPGMEAMMRGARGVIDMPKKSPTPKPSAN